MSVLFYIFDPEILSLNGFHLDDNKNYSMQLSYNSNRIYANFGNQYEKRINKFEFLNNDIKIYWEDQRDGKSLKIMLEKYFDNQLKTNLNLSFRIGMILRSLKDANE
jgi:hypothetical protein